MSFTKVMDNVGEGIVAVGTAVTYLLAVGYVSIEANLFVWKIAPLILLSIFIPYSARNASNLWPSSVFGIAALIYIAGALIVFHQQPLAGEWQAQCISELILVHGIAYAYLRSRSPKPIKGVRFGRKSNDPREPTA